MWSLIVEVNSPCVDGLASMGVACEQMLIRALIPQPADEQFNKAVLHRFAWCDVVPFDNATIPTDARSRSVSTSSAVTSRARAGGGLRLRPARVVRASVGRLGAFRDLCY